MDVRLTEFTVHGLYGLYTHKVDFNRAENLSILHGPNGVGKTAFLKCIRYTFTKSFDELLKITFDTITLSLSNGDSFVLNKILSVDNDDETENIKLDIHLFQGSTHYVKTYTHREKSDWFWMKSSLKTRHMFGIDTDTENEARDSERKIANAAIDKSLSSVSVRFIETNRLFRTTAQQEDGEKDIVILTVQECADDLVTHISTALRNYGTRSQILDQSFPRRFLSDKTKQLNAEELKLRLAGLEKKLKNLRDINLLDAEALSPIDLGSLDSVEQSKIDVLSLYVRDSEKKLSTFDAFAARVQLLLESLKLKFRNKQVYLSRDRGLYVRLDSGDEIALEALSSGEQHELVLMYELLFKVPAGALVLIDEPELSLHVSWQKAFLPELISIAKEAQFSALVATHSPFIVGDRWDLMVALDAEAHDE